MIGRTLDGRKIVERIGAGGMATVYKALDPETERFVAIKVLPERFADDATSRERFRREAKAIAGLEHLHILPMYDYGEDPETGAPFLVMRYMDAGTLADRLKSGPLSLPESARLFEQIASALNYAHQQGVIHRDVKPSNVLLDSQNNAYLTDFGLARVEEEVSNLTGTGGAIGTPHYMSPEQCRGAKNVTASTDIYALGITLYEMITGRVPFSADTPLAIVHMHLNDPPPPPRTVRPDLPQSVERVILKALEKEPRHRFESPEAMHVALSHAVLAGSQMSAEQGYLTEPLTGVVSYPRKPIRRWIALAGLLTAGTLLAVALLSGSFSVDSQRIGGNTEDDAQALTLEGHTAAVHSVAWSPDGTRVASASHDNSVIVWDLSTSDPLFILRGHTDDATSVAWSADGKWVASGSKDNVIFVWDAESGELVRRLRGQDGPVHSVAWSPDGQRLASGTEVGTVNIWDTTENELVSTFDGEAEAIGSVIWSADGSMLLSGSLRDEVIIVWDVESGERLRYFETLGAAEGLPSSPFYPISIVAWSPDGSKLGLSGLNSRYQVVIFDALTGDLVDDLTDDDQSRPYSMAWSADSVMLAAGFGAGSVAVWDTTTGEKLQTFQGESYRVNDLAWFPSQPDTTTDEAWLAAGLENGTVVIWRLLYD